MGMYTNVYRDAIHSECMKCYVVVVKLAYLYS